MFIEKYIKESIDIKTNILKNSQTIETIQSVVCSIVTAIKNGNKILLAGNGGSAADAQHIATEFVVKFYKKRNAYQAIALTTDTSILTAISNDNSFEEVFSRQIEALGVKGDIFIAISTSGQSKNVINALKKAKEKGLQTIGLTGEKPSEMDKYCDIILKVPSPDTPKIQEAHIMLGHIICALVEQEIN